jgi:hypothetical protein
VVLITGRNGETPDDQPISFSAAGKRTYAGLARWSGTRIATDSFLTEMNPNPTETDDRRGVPRRAWCSPMFAERERRL